MKWIPVNKPPKRACAVLILHEVDDGELKEDKATYNPEAIEGWEWETTFLKDPAAWKCVRYYRIPEEQ